MMNIIHVFRQRINWLISSMIRTENYDKRGNVLYSSKRLIANTNACLF